MTVHSGVILSSRRRIRSLSNASTASSLVSLRKLGPPDMDKAPHAKPSIGLLVVMFLYVANAGALLSLQAPFYPLEAEKKGATPAEVS